MRAIYTTIDQADTHSRIRGGRSWNERRLHNRCLGLAAFEVEMIKIVASLGIEALEFAQSSSGTHPCRRSKHDHFQAHIVQGPSARNLETERSRPLQSCCARRDCDDLTAYDWLPRWVCV